MRNHVLRTAVFVTLVAVFSAAHAADADKVTTRPADTGGALVNPDMGWTMHFYSNIATNYGSKLKPADTLDDFPGLSTVYLRVPWAYLEPQEGQFNWALFDTPAQRWIAKGKRIAIRVSCSESWLRFATPEWVKQAGAKGVFFNMGMGPAENGGLWDPGFGDPVFIEKLDRFLAAMAARYDGNPSVAFIDVGSYGLWGEGHTLMSSKVPEDRSDPVVRRHIDLYCKHFKHTLLCISDDVVGHDKPGRHFPLTDYALSKGVSLRDDSICVQAPPNSWFHAEMAQEFWPKLPVILEHEHYGPSKERNAWRGGALLAKSVEEYHASYMSIHWWPREELAENREIIDQINRRLGYRLQLREASWPARVRIGQPFAVEWTWANAGVAPCHPGGFPALTLKDDKGGIVAVCSDETLNLRTLPVGPPGEASVKPHQSLFTVGLIAPTTRPGTYDVYVSVGRRDGTPVIALPYAEDDGQRRYLIGKVTLEQ
ncbi:MAG TPA: DUF4832 domain-containing protein [Phycisphaerae bacterium]|nr:DUF4832 domain-containing protein [Phycisphaerae bacterium]HRY68587.1 DUF4832 domain-containing protein [Phycisphaerae bacterium]HSA25636.1 DUF4832 domain-containing protein [Phycisphaerae bacterium]